MNSYNNVPNSKNPNSDSSTVQAFDTYYVKPLEIDAGTLDAIKGLFTSRGFEPVAAESVAVILIRQAKNDGYNALQIADTLRGFGDLELSALVAEILNYNRYKTSFLGYGKDSISNFEVVRNILP